MLDSYPEVTGVSGSIFAQNHFGDETIDLACGAEYIITPEKGYDKKELCDIILDGKKKGKMHNLILLAEGVGGVCYFVRWCCSFNTSCSYNFLFVYFIVIRQR